MDCEVGDGRRDGDIVARLVGEYLVPPYAHVLVPHSTATGAEGNVVAYEIDNTQVTEAIQATYGSALPYAAGLSAFVYGRNCVAVSLTGYDDVHSYNMRASELLGQYISGPFVLIATIPAGQTVQSVAHELLRPVQHVRAQSRWTTFWSGVRTTLTGALSSLSLNRFFAAPHEIE